MNGNIGNSIFQGAAMNIDTVAQNLEEEEELEDQKRRQEEIQSLLTKAMDDFNYDEQSTFNSSTNISGDYTDHYKEAPLHNQLEVLYNIRVKEVETLTQKLLNIEKEFASIKSHMQQKLMIVEAENDTLKTTLKNSQELMVDKCNQLEIFQVERENFQLEITTLKKHISKLESEKEVIEYNNKDLAERVAILENGAGTNPLANAAMQEAYHLEVSKLQSTLDTAYFKIQRLETENEDLTEKFNSAMSQKEDLIASKSEVINKLTQNVDQAQEHNRELLEDMNKMSGENERLKKHVQDMENNLKIMKGFTDKTEMIKILQKELEKFKNNNAKQIIEYDKLSKEYSVLMEEVNAKDEKLQMIEENIKLFEAKPSMTSNSLQTSIVMDHSVVEQLRDELTAYKENLEEKESTNEKLMEKISILEEDINKLNQKLQLSAQRDNLTQELQEKAAKLEEIILNNQKPDSEDKAILTDPFIPQNTEFTEDQAELFKMQLDSELIQKEIQLRNELEQEYENRYTTLKQNISECIRCDRLSKELETKVKEALDLRLQIEETLNRSLPPCQMCSEMSANLTRNVEVIQHQEAQLLQFRNNQEKDREVIVKVLEEWKQRFDAVEHENQIMKEKLESALKSYAATHAELNMMKKSEVHLVETIKIKAQEAVRSWSVDTLQQMKKQNQKLMQTKARIEHISRRADSRIKEIEEKFEQVQLNIKCLPPSEFNKMNY